MLSLKTQDFSNYSFGRKVRHLTPGMKKFYIYLVWNYQVDYNIGPWNKNKSSKRQLTMHPAPELLILPADLVFAGLFASVFAGVFFPPFPVFFFGVFRLPLLKTSTLCLSLYDRRTYLSCFPLFFFAPCPLSSFLSSLSVSSLLFFLLKAL